MNHYTNVLGSQQTVTQLEVNVDTVYVRSNIRRIETERFTGWQYDEIQYTLREYQELIGTKTEQLENENTQLKQENTQLADTLEMILVDVLPKLMP